MEATDKAIIVIDHDGNTNVHKMAVLNHIDGLQSLNDIDVDQPNIYGWTPLMMAARKGRLQACMVLLQKRADATKTSYYRANSFILACASGNLDVMNLILQHLLSGGVSFNSLETFLSPFAIAMLFRNVEVFRYLLSKRFNPRVLSLDAGISLQMFAGVNINSWFWNILGTLGIKPHVQSKTQQGSQQAMGYSGTLEHNNLQVPATRYISEQDDDVFLPNNCSPRKAILYPRRSSNIQNSPNILQVSPIAPILPGCACSQVFFPSISPAVPYYHEPFIPYQQVPEPMQYVYHMYPVQQISHVVTSPNVIYDNSTLLQ